MRRGAKRYSAYKVVDSDMPDIEQGKILIDVGWDLTRVWDFVDYTDPEFGVQAVVGERIARLCPVCVSRYDRAAALGHPGEHGKKAPQFDDREQG